MDNNLQKLEADLAALNPAKLDEALLERLNDAANGRLTETDDSLRQVESALAKLRPVALPGGMIESFAERVERVPFSMDDKVLLFPGSSSSAPSEKTGSRRGWLAAAAAVALAGAFSAFLYTPGSQEDAGVATTARESRAPLAAPIDGGAFAPASFGSNLSDTSDLGLVWSKDRRPVRVMRVVFTDRVNFKNANGETVVLEIPRVEYLAVPEKID